MASARKPYPPCDPPGHYGEDVHVPSPSLPLLLPSIASIDPDSGVSAPFVADPDSGVSASFVAAPSLSTMIPSIASIDSDLGVNASLVLAIPLISQEVPSKPTTNALKKLEPHESHFSQSTFFRFSQLDEYVAAYAKDNNFIATHQRKNAVPSSFFNALDVSDRKIPSRGHFYCSPLSARRCKGQKCTFKVPYLLDRKNKEYRFTSNIVLSHSHTLHSHLVVLDGKVLVNLENDLTTAEGYLIKQLSCARVNVPQMSTVLERMFTGSAFTPQLLRRNTLDQTFGKDRHNLPGLFEKCESVRRNGGLFIVEPSTEDFGIKSIHCQSKLMGEYASKFGDVRMADGTFQVSQYDFVFIIWMGIDGLCRSVFHGMTCNFSENADAIIKGVKMFYPSRSSGNDSKIEIGELGDQFCPFTDNTIDVLVPPSRSSEVLLNDEKVCFVSDEGAAFKETARHFGWNHVYDRKHFTAKIYSHWGGLKEPEKYKKHIHQMLDTADVDKFNLLVAQARELFETKKSQELVDKIVKKKHNVCFSFTSKWFTCGHVSDQRSEGGMSSMKANGKLTTALKQFTFGESVDRIFSVSRQQDKNRLDEMVSLRIANSKVGIRYAAALKKSKADAMHLSHVESFPNSSTKYVVKQKLSSPHSCIVDFEGLVTWNGKKYSILTGTCSFFTSTFMICPCACAASQRNSFDIDSISNVHPR